MNKEKRLTQVHIILIILGSFFVSLSIFHENLWFDEAYSVGIANQSFADIWKIGSFDVHPVIYYLALKVLNLTTNGSVIGYRVFSDIAIILMGILGITHIKKDFGARTGIIFTFLCYFLPVMPVYANEIRMYSWSAYISSVLLIYSNRICLGKNNFKNWIIFGICGLLSIYTHYYGLLLVTSINFLFLIHLIKNKKWSDLKKQIIITILQFILYIPWLFNLLKQIKHVSKGFWIGFEFPKTILELLGYQMSGNINIWLGFIVNILLLIYLTGIYIRKKKNTYIKSVEDSVKVYLIIIALTLIISIVFGTSILYYRYLFVLIGLYIFVLSYLLNLCNNKHIFIIFTIIFVLGVYSNIIQIKNNYAKENGEQIEYLKQNIREKDTIVYMDNEIGSCFAVNFLNNKQYFYNPEDWGVIDAYKVWYPQLEVYINSDFLEKCTNRVWIIDTQNKECYNEIFNNENFEYINSYYIATKYKDYIYNIILVEKAKE